jgi:hypothetical protein
MNIFWSKEGKADTRIAVYYSCLSVTQEGIGASHHFCHVCLATCSYSSFTKVDVRNHPVIKDDGVLAIFLTEPSFETWRKHTSVSLEEESASKRVDRIEEMSIPSDLDEKLAYDLISLISRTAPLIEILIESCGARSVPSLNNGNVYAYLRNVSSGDERLQRYGSLQHTGPFTSRLTSHLPTPRPQHRQPLRSLNLYYLIRTPLIRTPSRET